MGIRVVLFVLLSVYLTGNAAFKIQITTAKETGAAANGQNKMSSSVSLDKLRTLLRVERLRNLDYDIDMPNMNSLVMERRFKSPLSSSMVAKRDFIYGKKYGIYKGTCTGDIFC